jgi:hypothetical protein
VVVTGQPWRVPGAPHATTVLMVDLLPGTYSFCDLYREAPPILVIDAGPTELHLSLPVDRVTVDDLGIIDQLLEGVVAFRSALIGRLVET